MTLAHATDRLASDCLLLRRIVPDDPASFTCVHTLPEVALGSVIAAFHVIVASDVIAS